jgi:hypothetical protein
MGFIDNSGDIILDAVLTDEGRRRLALGDGSFRIAKFAVGDDEIDYSLYDTAPTSGSGYEDLRILKLPVFEAFTNNVTSLKNRLVTYSDNSLLYLPVVKLNTKNDSATSLDVPGGYYVSVDSTTSTQITDALDTATSSGYRLAHPGATAEDSRIICDQGLDTGDLSVGLLFGTNEQQQSVFESGYIIELDNRLLSVATTTGGNPRPVAQPSFIDDDNVASYMLNLNRNSGYFAAQRNGNGGDAQPAYELTQNQGVLRVERSVIGLNDQTGRLGSRLIFSLRSNNDVQLQNSTHLFDTLGGTVTIAALGGLSFKFINTVIRITGMTTGSRLEIPLKLLKYTA